MRALATGLLIATIGSAQAAPGADAQETTPAVQAVRIGGEIKEPKKVKHVPPLYPDAAKQAGAQGSVILEATIGPEGNVTAVRVVQGIPLLDQAAIDAVKQWVYTPTLLNGRPVPVIMTVTLNFLLSGALPVPAPQPTGSPEKLADIRRLLDLNGSRATSLKATELMLAAVRSRAKPETPPEIWDALEQELKAEHMEEWSVALYDKYFTHDQIREFIRFYETPAGRALGATQPALAQDSMAQVASRGPALMKRMLDRLRAGGYLKQ
jgi:TonB family protein